MRFLYQAVYAVTLVAAGAAGSFVWMRQIEPQLDANHILHSVSWSESVPRIARFRSRPAGSADAWHRRSGAEPSALHSELRSYEERNRSLQRRL